MKIWLSQPVVSVAWSQPSRRSLYHLTIKSLRLIEVGSFEFCRLCRRILIWSCLGGSGSWTYMVEASFCMRRRMSRIPGGVYWRHSGGIILVVTEFLVSKGSHC